MLEEAVGALQQLTHGPEVGSLFNNQAPNRNIVVSNANNVSGFCLLILSLRHLKVGGLLRTKSK